ncbi:MAG: CarD family transcriptional regulator, partial [Lachnospiraceae bacterium]|nr:CarD family transcriptional regulator [Lachnospiraceae bacterium]
CDCRDWIKIIKTLYQRKRERLARGKKTTAMDERYLRMAEENLYSELSLVLGVPREDMEDYITQRLTVMAMETAGSCET